MLCFPIRSNLLSTMPSSKTILIKEKGIKIILCTTKVVEAHVLGKGVSINMLYIRNTDVILGFCQATKSKKSNSNDVSPKMGSSIPRNATSVPSSLLRIILYILY